MEITGITAKLSKTLVAKSKKKVALVDFVDLQGRPNELGRFLAEQLSVELVNAEGISVVDRANIKSILAEHKLTEEGLVNPENAKKLGQFAGVDAILIGTVTPMDDSIILTVKAVSTDTAEVIAAGKVSFKKTSEIQQLLNRMASSPSSGSTTVGAGSGGNASYSEADAIAIKDVGDLRIVLKSIRPIKDDDSRKQVLQLVLELINRNLKEGALVAANSSARNFDPHCARAYLLDATGSTWNLATLGGLPLVGAKGGGDPASVVEHIKKGHHLSLDGMYFGGDGLEWGGGFALIAPSQSMLVTMTFIRQGEQHTGVPESVQFGGELVVGSGAIEQPENCALINLIYDNVKLKKDGN
jgi:TolB-like protein